MDLGVRKGFFNKTSKTQVKRENDYLGLSKVNFEIYNPFLLPAASIHCNTSLEFSL